MGLMVQTRLLLKYLNDRLYQNSNGSAVMSRVRIKRVYDKPSEDDGFRILVDRLWPRGLTKERAAIDEWAKEIAPTSRLRNWFDHDPYHWESFKKKYLSELNQNQEMEKFVKRHEHRKTITLVYSTKYDKMTHAIILKQVLDKFYK